MTASDKPTVLVVEDNAVTRLMLRLTLEGEGYIVLEAPDARAALAQADRRPPDLILQDIVLPDLDGRTLVGRLRALPGCADIPILALTGFASRFEELDGGGAGFTAMLVKPVEPEQIITAVAAHLPIRHGAGPSGDGRRVLVVDDDPVQLKLLRLQLGQLGFAVATADSAGEALSAARGSPPDVILADLMMPETDGFSFCFRVRRDPGLRAVPVVLLSATFQTPADEDMARRVGASALLVQTPEIGPIAAALLDAVRAGAPPAAEEPAEPFSLDHAYAVIRQLNRQLAAVTSMARRSTLQAAQLALLGGIADALARRADLGAALHGVLSATLDAAAISKGALFLTAADGRPELRDAVGWSEGERDGLARFFGRMSVLEHVIGERVTVSLPSETLPAATTAILSAAGATTLDIVPLISDGRGVGAMVLGAKGGDLSSEDTVLFARAIGSQIVKSLELAQAFERLASSEQRYRTLMESASDVIAVLAPDGTIREANRRAVDLLGVGPGDALAVGGRRGAAIEVSARDGSTRLLEFSITNLDVGGEKLVLAIGRDVTEKTHSSALLMFADRIATIGTLAAGVVHEINNPLASVMANLELAHADAAELAAAEGPESRLAEIVEVLRDAREGTERVGRIVGDLKLLSGGEDDKRTAVDVVEVLSATLRLAWSAIRHRARLIKELGHVPPVEANEARLGQLFRNLILHATQTLAEGHADENELRVVTRTDEAGRAVVEISDNGPSLPPEVKERLFTSVVHDERPGAGMGLIVSKRIVVSIGGDLTVHEPPGGGTLFRVTLPASRRRPAVSMRPALTEARRRGRVLVVDDEPMVAASLRRLLAYEHDVITLTSAREALGRVSNGDRYDVILCDLMMPVMTGFELHQELLRVAPEQAARMVFLTAGAFTPKARAFLNESDNRRLEKPFDLKDVRAVVNDMLR